MSDSEAHLDSPLVLACRALGQAMDQFDEKAVKPGDRWEVPYEMELPKLGKAASQDYAEEFLNAVKRQLKVKRNNSAIEAFRTRLTSSGG